MMLNAALLLLGALAATHPVAAPVTSSAEPSSRRAAEPPTSIMIATTRGEMVLPVRTDAWGGPAVYASPLMLALGGSIKLSGAWAEVVISGQSLRLLVGAPFYVQNNKVQPMAGRVSLIRDTLFVPLQFVAEALPRLFGERLAWDAENARLVEEGWQPSASSFDNRSIELTEVPAGPRRDGPRLPNGLRPGHIIVVDPGHGGEDNGNPGLFLPRGLKEKDITLQVGLLLRRELEEEGIQVRMTRTTDVLPRLLGRAPQCRGDCDIFVSLHVDALDPRTRPNYRQVNGFHTIIVGEENTEDAARVARMENEALRFEDPADQEAASDLAFLLKDLQMNEFLRESARAGALIQEHLDAVHSGANLGVKQRKDLAVLNTARRPAVLVEMGFATSPTDARILATPSSQRQLAQALADALVAYLLEYERRVGG
jgi:N-acetylmuramoyl-L-alanine amidase